MEFEFHRLRTRMDLMRDATVLLWISPMLAPTLDMVQGSRLKLANLLWYALVNVKEIPGVREGLTVVGLAAGGSPGVDLAGGLAQLWFVVCLAFLLSQSIADWETRFWMLFMTTGYVVITDLLWSSEQLAVNLEPGWFTDRTLHYCVAVCVALGVGFPWNSYEARLSILLVQLCNYNLIKLFSLGAPWRIGFWAYARGFAWAIFPIASASFILGSKWVASHLDPFGIHVTSLATEITSKASMSGDNDVTNETESLPLLHNRAQATDRENQETLRV